MKLVNDLELEEQLYLWHNNIEKKRKANIYNNIDLNKLGEVNVVHVYCENDLIRVKKKKKVVNS